METVVGAELGVAVFDHEGPTGSFVEVLQAKVVDYGGNDLGSRVTTARGAARAKQRWRIPTQLVAVKTGQEIGYADVLCDY